MSDDLILGIEIGGTKLQLVLGNADGAILERVRLHVVSASGGSGIRRQIEEALPNLLKGRKVASVGVGFGGPVDYRTGKICCSHQIEGWSDFEFGAWLEKLAKAPVRVDNDANTAALAEALRGAGTGANPVFYVTMGSGVGGGLVVDGKIYHGAIPGEAEIGHIRLDKTGRILEESCSGWAVDKKIRAAIQAEPRSKLAQLVGNTTGGEAKQLVHALAEKDSSAIQIINDTADDLAFGLSHVVHLVHPQTIVLGGGLSLVGATIQASVQEALPRYTMHAFHPVPQVRIAALGEDVVPVGALLMGAEIQKKTT